MKLLAVRMCDHDSNFSYWDGDTLHYYKSERSWGVKHHGFQNMWEWKEEIKDLWNLEVEDLDDVVFILDEDTPDFFPATSCGVTELEGYTRLHHHYAHALSGKFLTNKADCSIVLDGFGDNKISWSVIKDDQLIAFGRYPNSIGDATEYVGHVAGCEDNRPALYGNDLPGKLMGLQSYGKVSQEFVHTLPDNIDQCHFASRFERWVDFKGDNTVAELSKLDWAASIHHHLGTMVMNLFKQYCNKDDVIVYSGGVALNVIWNTRLKEEFPNLVVVPYCSDEGLSLGGIEYLRMVHDLPKFTLDNFPYIQSDEGVDTPSDETIDHCAELLSQGHPVGWYQGNGEVGPRALGNRSILMDPRMPDGKVRMNRVKQRENYRPFGASVLEDHASEYFDIDYESPYMLYVADVKDKIELQSITHVDGTCRIQTVGDYNPTYKKLLERFYQLTGCPVLMNTSLNVAGKGICGSRREALHVLHDTKLQHMFIGDEYASTGA